MIKIAISFTLGCLLFLQLPTMPAINWFWGALPVSILLLFKHSRLLAIASLGALWTLCHAHHITNNQLADDLVGQDLVVIGTIANIPAHKNHRISFDFTVDKPAHGLPQKLRLNWYHPFPDDIYAGEKWRLTVRLKKPRGLINPGGFDYERWLFQERIGATGYVRKQPDNKRIKHAPFYSIDALRQTVTTTIHRHLNNSPHFALIKGLTTGVRHDITQKQWQVLRLSGTSHLLAISGLHIGLAAALGFFLFRWLWSRKTVCLLWLPAKEAGAIGGFIVALFYAALAGFAIPSQRAMIMVGVVMASLLFRRPITAGNILAISLLLVLAVDPLSVLSAGFWLSFGAVAIILFISQHRFFISSPRWRWTKINIKIHALITLGLTPLLLIFFLQTSLIAPVANFIAIPVISLFVVPVLLTAIILLWLIEPMGAWLLSTAEYVLDFLWVILDYLAGLPYASWEIVSIPAGYWLPIILGALMLIMPKKIPAKWLGILGFSPLFLVTPDKPDKGEFWLTLLDVGQGLSAVVQTHNHALVFDTGAKFSDSFNIGTGVIKPFLQHQRIKKIDTLIVSHDHADHIGGAIPLMGAMEVTNVLSSSAHKLLSSAPCYAGQSWQWDGIDFIMLHPDESAADTAKNSNNRSCVLKIRNKTHSVLLAADIEYPAEQKLVARYGDTLKSTILVAPHHGSNTSSSDTFISTVSPDIVLFPIGYRNRYRHPAKAVVNRYQTKDIKMLNSADHGAIQFKMAADSYALISTWRQASAKIWRSNTTE